MINLLDLYSLAEDHGTQVVWFDLEAAESLSMPLSDGSCAIAMNPWRMPTVADETVKLNTGVRFPSPAPHKKPAKALIFNTFAGFSFIHFLSVMPFQGITAHFSGGGTGGGNRAPAHLFST